MTKALETLMFTVGLIDKVSQPIAAVQQTVNDVTRSAKRGFHDIQMGAIGLAAAGVTIAASLAPAREMARALGEVKSLDVTQSALDQLQQTALAFSTQYGESAANFVRASYDIQSAIGALTGNELAAFTNASAILAKGTKSDVATITDYMGTMYGVYAEQAEKIGKANWVEQVAGQTASAVQMFKTTGAQMAAAASSVGANAASLGVSMAEQMAILGTLQKTMSGSEAGTKYRAFLAGVGKAQQALGLSFTNAQGQLLPMVQIIEQLKGKFGNTLDVAESDALSKAFGTQEATSLIKLLMSDTQGLAASINKLGSIKGMAQAQKMAEAMIDPFDQAGASVKAIATSFGLALLPAIQPALNAFAVMAGWLVTLTQEYPLLTKIVGVTALTIIGVSASMALLTLAVGFSKSAFAGWLLTQKALSGTLVAFKSIMWLVNAAMLANPVGLIVAGITALVVGIGAAIVWWNDLKAALSNIGWIKAIGEFFSFVFNGIKQTLMDAINWIINKVNLIPFVSIEKFGADTEVSATPAIPTLEQTKKTTSVPGGISQQIKSMVRNNTQSSSIGEINITTNMPANAIKNELAML